MKNEILFLTDDSPQDAIAYCLLCYYAQTTKTSLRVVLAQHDYHSRIAEAFRNDTTVLFTASLHTSVTYLDSYELEQCDKQFATLHDLCRKFSIPHDVEFAAGELACESSYYLPSVLANMLHRRMGLIEFGNYVARKWIEDIHWDIARDPDVIDIVDPPEV